jgi:DegV family protein with EDD domain
VARVGIVTDSTADFPLASTAAGAADVVPLVVSWSGATYRDKVDLPTGEFYERLRGTRELPTTGAPSLAAFMEVYRAGLERYERLVSLHLSGKLSGTYQVARAAAAEVDAQHITVIDSGTLSICLGWMVEDALRMVDAGAEPDAIARQVMDMRPRLRIYFSLNTLEFLQRGGRIGKAQAFAGALLSIKPILTIEDSEVLPIERVRTQAAAHRRLAELASRTPDIERLAVVQGAAPEAAEELARLLAPSTPGVTIERVELGTVLGTHGGPGVVAVGILAR